MKKAIFIAVVLLVLGAAASYWYLSDRGRFTSEPEYAGLARRVSDNDLISEKDPELTLRFAATYQYLGGQKFILYGVANAEQHFFVETTGDNKLESVYWVQYEAYLPDIPYSYDYDDSPLRLILGDYEFYTDTDTGEFDPNKKRRRGTDGAMARQFLARKGYAFPGDYAYARMIYLTDESRRKELMIIFIDDLAAYGLSAAELNEGATSSSRRPEIEQAHLDKVRNTLAVIPHVKAN